MTDILLKGLNIRGLRQKARQLLADSLIPSVINTPLLDVDCILSFITSKSKSYLLAHDDTYLSENDFSLFCDLLNKRLSGLPVAYIVGKKEFFGYEFTVTPDVLIPKPDTELLVEHAICVIKKLQLHNKPIFAADICTGSGCIAISVLLSLYNQFNTSNKFTEDIQFFATDISYSALKIAQINAENLLPKKLQDKIEFLQGDLCSPLNIKLNDKEDVLFDVIMSNPPYVPKLIVKDLLLDGRSEPILALDGDSYNNTKESDDGLNFIRHLIPQVYKKLCVGGVFLLETGEYNALQAAECLKNYGFTDVKIYKDLAGNLRLIEAQKYDQ